MPISQKLIGKRIIVGISGGIAAYKACTLIRLFIKAGAEVKVVVTPNAFQFVTEITLKTLSKNLIYHDVFWDNNFRSPEHIALTDWGDIFVVAPATGNIIGKYANGIADDALSTSLMAFDGQVVISPAMNGKMYNNFAVRRNMEILISNGIKFIEPGSGELACGYEGKGRMAEPEEIYREVEYLLRKTESLEGKKILITASRTEEPLDPIRYLSNMSSGKTGFRLAEAFACRGAEVVLVAGPSTEIAYSAVDRVDVRTAQEMFEAVDERFSDCDCCIMTAAVADYTFDYSETKIKKKENDNHFAVKRTKDILKEISLKKRPEQILAGFALETDKAIENAQAKLKKKNLDFIVLNTTDSNNQAFRSESNTVTIIDKDNSKIEYPLLSKSEICEKIVDKTEILLKKARVRLFR